MERESIEVRRGEQITKRSAGIIRCGQSVDAVLPPEGASFQGDGFAQYVCIAGGNCVGYVPQDQSDIEKLSGGRRSSSG